MATLKANGGIARRWVRKRRSPFLGHRLVLCANGRMLINMGGKWHRWSDGGDAEGLVGRVEAGDEWQEVEKWKTWR